jgi:DNA-binding Xre family transcriptional regulator
MTPIINKHFVQGRLHDQRRTQRDLSNFVGIDPAAMCKLLNGTRHIDWYEAALMCKTLKCSMADLGLVIDADPTQTPAPPANSTSIQLMGGYEVQITIKELL